MAKFGTPKETIGSSISTKVADQITAREILFRSTPDSNDLSKILALNANVAWVKLRSSINKLLPKDIPETTSTNTSYPHTEWSTQQFKDYFTDLTQSREDKVPVGSSSQAKSFILSGGILRAGDNPMKEGLDFTLGANTNSRYNNSRTTGIRPMGGITGVKIASKNTYGTLMSADVSFVVWTVEDLEQCEFLYFRPGYSALLEVGHSMYISRKDKTKKPTSTADLSVEKATSKTHSIPDKTFFDDNISMEALEKEVQNLRESKEGNYEGVFGFITNFSWKFRKDGGYDCTVSIVSKGIILESLKAGGSSYSSDSTIGESSTQKQKSALHRICVALEASRANSVEGGLAYLQKVEPELYSSFPKTGVNDFPLATLGGSINLGGEDTRVSYLPLYTVLDIFNTFYILKGGSSVANLKPIIPIYTGGGNQFLTFNEHYSTDPLVALPVYKPSTNSVDGNPIYASFNLGAIQDVMWASSQLWDEPSFKERSEIMNIMVSTYFLKKQMDTLQDSDEQDNISVYDVIRNMLAGIQTALGNVNAFELALGSTNTEYVVIDRNAIRLRPKAEIPVITVAGLGSTILDLSIESKISSKVASQVAIAAQGSTGNYKENVEALLRWNLGAIDRHIPLKRLVANTPAQSDDNRKGYIAKMAALWAAFSPAARADTSNSTSGGTAGGTITMYVKSSGTYNETDWKNIQTLAAEDLNRLYQLRLQKSGTTASAALPVEVNLKMLGISGFKIGLVYRMSSQILPKKYDNFAYIITGLDHEIGTNNLWTTNIKSQYFPMPVEGEITIKEAMTKDYGTNSQQSPTTPDTPGIHPNAERMEKFIKENLSPYITLSRSLINPQNMLDYTSSSASGLIAALKAIGDQMRRDKTNCRAYITSGLSGTHTGTSNHHSGHAIDISVGSSPSHITYMRTIMYRLLLGNRPTFGLLDEYGPDKFSKSTGKQQGHNCFHVTWDRINGSDKSQITDGDIGTVSPLKVFPQYPS